MTQIPVFCITTEHRELIRDLTQKQCKEEGVEISFVQGVNGRKWGLDTVKHYEPGKKIPPGHIGLNLSHWMLWNFIVTMEIHEAIIMEDDVVLCKGFLDELAKTFEEMPPKTELTFLGHVNSEDRITERLNERHARCHMPFGTHCYWLHYQGAWNLLRYCDEARFNIDQQMWYSALHKMPFTIATPSLATQRSFTGEWDSVCGGAAA